MATPDITQMMLNSAKVLVGPKKTALRGAAEDFFELTPAADSGGSITGIQGDVTLYTRVVNAYDISVTLQPGSKAIGTLLTLGATGQAFPIAIQFGDFKWQGWAVIKNMGSVTSTQTPTPRVITLSAAYQSGNIFTGTGSTVGAA